MVPAEGGEPDGERHQPTWRKVALLGVPLLLVVGYVGSMGWGATADHFGRRVAADRANEVEAAARAEGLDADRVTLSAALDDPLDDLGFLEVPGTELEQVSSREGAGDAHLLLRSTAWGGRQCIRLDVGGDGDISTRVRSCGFAR